ncbi:uncharacterized protein LOC105665363 [Ceratitis capitata]|uniref:(Mediterranean fruit fly) hypothetical protein n=2 Tax=Ceratitis capitata TaxID=7213 RepID=A0A811VKQ4_CERCA|nr:uncharacterized protein LOC105665363 [Ceratitis capitata]CAD7014672.1 unnamed protein product [Ceratitis capitata]
MLCTGGRSTIFILTSFLAITVNISHVWSGSIGSTMPLRLSEIVKSLLNNIEKDGHWNENIASGLLFAEFLVKQKMQQQKTTVLDTGLGSLYLDILEKISSIRSGVIQSFGVHNLQSLFQDNLMITSFEMRTNQIDKNIEFKSMVRNYSSTPGTGFPSNTFTGICLLHMQGLELCDKLRRNCLPEIKISPPTYGYRRTYQALLLYFLMHHTCARFYGNRLSFEIIATEHCSQVYREHQIIAALGPRRWYELYVEQSSICGLFGFEEFLDYTELTRIIDLESTSACNCIKSLYVAEPTPDLCRCTDRKHSNLLILFTNAMLFLI